MQEARRCKKREDSADQTASGGSQFSSPNGPLGVEPDRRGFVDQRNFMRHRGASCVADRRFEHFRALFRMLFRALSLAQSGNVSRAVSGAIRRGGFGALFRHRFRCRFGAVPSTISSAVLSTALELIRTSSGR